jgi:hypothetical protein
MKNSNDTIGNRTDLPTCSAVPQPTAPLRAPVEKDIKLKLGEPQYFCILYLEPNPMEQITTSNTSTLLAIQDNMLSFVNTKGSFLYSKR